MSINYDCMEGSGGGGGHGETYPPGSMEVKTLTILGGLKIHIFVFKTVKMP